MVASRLTAAHVLGPGLLSHDSVRACPAVQPMAGMEELDLVVKRVFAAQEARVIAYSGFETAYRLLSNGGSDSAYVSQTKDVTGRFQESSKQINDCISDFQKVPIKQKLCCCEPDTFVVCSSNRFPVQFN